MDKSGERSSVDQTERARTLDTQQSFLVQAPAGSGKTELLTRRLLKLLAEVDEPEEILAITFTLKATAEMRERVLSALQKAEETAPSQEDGAMTVLARAALANDARRGWHLLQQPQRLSILTIDAVCLTIAHETPLLSQLGGSLSPTDKPQPLYDLAARRTLARLGDGGPISEALRALLELRATSLPGCQNLIAGMLDKRDQWGRVLPLHSTVDWLQVRDRLEAPLRQLQQDALLKAQSLFTNETALAEELVSLLQHACGNVEEGSPILAARAVTHLDQLTSHEHWMGVCELLLTKGGTYRKQLTKEIGFPGGKAGQQAKARLTQLLLDLGTRPEILQTLCGLRGLPPTTFTDEEFALLQHLLVILRYAVAELRVVFAERSMVDFVELGLAAHEVLTDEEGKASELAAEVAGRWRHMLVDEFQDTSRSQYELLILLASAWEASERGTCFLVGDPMQSIYSFRQAEVELFERTRLRGLGEGSDALVLAPIQLQTNFRSHAGLVNRLNEIFTLVFAQEEGQATDEYHVAFAPSTAQEPAKDQEKRTTQAVRLWPRLITSKATPEETRASADAEAKQVVSIIQEHWPKVEEAERLHKEFKIAVLVRARSHLGLITERLRKADIPFRAVEIEQLGDRPEVRDLTALTRTLLHPMDRIAWLTVLRAPWCGLTLKDLHTLCGSDEKVFANQPVLTLLRERASLLSTDGRQRAERVLAILEDALRSKHRQASFARWVERTWATLGGHACVDRTAYENVRTFFSMLEELGPDASDLKQRLEELCAQPDPRADERHGVQLMTIHKAKGLGFDIVIVPGLERSTQGDDQPLLRWVEQTRLVGQTEQEERAFVVAPIGANGQSSGIYEWIGKQQSRRQDDEAKRLLYVAATRAREELHLLGTATIKEPKNGTQELSPGDKHSLLSMAWPAIREDFDREFAQQQRVQASTPEQTELVFPPLELTIPLRRLPAVWQGPEQTILADAETGVVDLPRGSLATRAFGTVVHALMEDLSRIPDTHEVESWRVRALALLRATGLPRAQAESTSRDVVRALQAVLRDPVGRWIVGARAGARNEVAWSTWEESAVRTLRGDRIFRAGAEPESLDETHLWIVDYKTAQHGASGLEAFLASEKEKYAPQLESYANVLRKLPGNDLPLRLALYFPLLSRLVWW